MPRACSICGHAERDAIDMALVEGVPYRAISRQWHVSKDAVARHAASHIPVSLARAAEAGEVARADDLLAQVQGLQARTQAILERAERSGELRTALAAIRESRGNLELLGRLAGEINDSPQINFLVSTEWIELRAVIIQALGSYPEARESVLEALGGTG